MAYKFRLSHIKYTTKQDHLKTMNLQVTLLLTIIIAVVTS